MRALVIGGTGFVGLNLVDALLAHGWAVSVPLRRHSITLHLRTRAVERRRVALEDPRALAEAMRGRDVVFMAAGHYPRYSTDLEAEVREGVDQIRRVAEAAVRAGVPRLVYTSSTGALAHVPGRAAREDDVPPARPEGSTYRAVKWSMERALERFADRLELVTMIPSGCVGPWDARAGTGRLLLGVVREELPFYVEGTVALVDVEDVAAAHVAAGTHPAPRARYCLGGHAVGVGALLEGIAARYGGAVPPRATPEAAREAADRAEREARDTRGRVAVPRELVDLVEHGQAISNDAAREDLGFTPRPLEASLDRAHEWYRSQGYLRTRKESRAACRPAPTDVVT